MRASRLWLLIGAFAMTTPVSAQQVTVGTATWRVTMKTPQTNPAAAMLGPTLTMQMTGSTDGRRVAMDMVLDSSAGMMAGMRTMFVFGFGDDTVHVGILLPASMAAAAGGASGMRMDVPLTQLAHLNMLGAADSAVKAKTDSLNAVTFHPLGTTATVAGLSCENWEIIGMGDTTFTCVIPTPSALLTLQQQFKAMPGSQAVLAQVPGLATLEQNAYGGRKMTSIRSEARQSGLRMELISASSAPPDSAAFVLPSDLRVVPFPAAGAGGGGGGPPR